MVPVRWFGPVLPATVNPTVPLPVPDEPEVTVMKDALLTAVQPQFPVGAMLTMPGLPEAEKFCEVGVRLKLWMPTIIGSEILAPQAFETITSYLPASAAAAFEML